MLAVATLVQGSYCTKWMRKLEGWLFSLLLHYLDTIGSYDIDDTDNTDVGRLSVGLGSPTGVSSLGTLAVSLSGEGSGELKTSLQHLTGEWDNHRSLLVYVVDSV